MPRPETTPEHAVLAEIAVDVARQAATLIRSRIAANDSIGRKSSPSDVFTQVDLDSEELLRETLLRATPGAGFIGEEGGEVDSADGAAPNSGSLQWIIDPLDGTVNFTYGIPLFAVSVAAAVGGAIVAGAVIEVLSGEVFAASLGGGAWRNGEPIVASSCTELHAAMVMTGFSYGADLRRVQGRVIGELLPTVRDIRCFGSAALELCWVACGRVDAYFERDTKLWDYAAGALIAREAGAQVELPCPENDSLMLAAPPSLFPVLRAAVDHPTT